MGTGSKGKSKKRPNPKSVVDATKSRLAVVGEFGKTARTLLRVVGLLFVVYLLRDLAKQPPWLTICLALIGSGPAWLLIICPAYRYWKCDNARRSSRLKSLELKRDPGISSSDCNPDGSHDDD